MCIHVCVCVCVCACACVRVRERGRFGFMSFINSDFKQMTVSELNSICPEINAFNAAKIHDRGAKYTIKLYISVCIF